MFGECWLLITVVLYLIAIGCVLMMISLGLFSC